jgi:catechol 2,3-dioxygenase-like lactoylglutathione lyase family enzyme
MLGNKDVMATIAVKDIDAAKQFYEGKLGLELSGPQMPGVLHYKAGRSFLMVYQSTYAGTNQATAATWHVGDNIELEVQELKGKGVTFEHYDMPDMPRQGDIHQCGDIKAAWFKDPDGNIINLSGE